jgi:putative transposase
MQLIYFNNSKLSIQKQCDLLSIPRSSLYYKSIKEGDIDNWLMNEIYEIWIKYPFYGYRRITAILNRSGYHVNNKKIRRIMSLMDLQAIYPKKKTTFADTEHKIYPYLLRDLIINKSNQVWATDITYIKMSKGFVYLVALIDLFSRKIINWQLSITMEKEFCIEMLEEALMLNKRPEIINSDQGSQFTCNEWTKVLINNNIKVSMDGKGRCIDNIFMERFWRSIKQEEIYIKPCDSVTEIRENIKKYINFYNQERPHQSLDYQTPDEVYFGKEKKGKAINFMHNFSKKEKLHTELIAQQ